MGKKNMLTIHLKVKDWHTYCILDIFLNMGGARDEKVLVSSRTHTLQAFPVTNSWYSNPRSDKLRWMTALSPNRRTRFMSASAHQTGEEQYHVMLWLSASLWMQMWQCTSTLWYISDSPQVQCIQSYSSQEPDELSIEMADVLNLLERTDDGLYSLSMITM